MVSCIITGNSSTFKYGADGLRRQKTTNSTSTDYAYDGTMLVREGHASGGTLTATITYFQGASGPCYRRDDTQTETDGQGHTFGKTRWYVYDGLGSVVGELDPLGDLTSSPKYDVYGAVRANGGTASSKQGFVGGLGHLSEPETGLIYMRARYYDPSLGRFASEDPKQSGNNWFVYCNDNPVNRSDPTGKEWFDDLMDIGAIGLLICAIIIDTPLIVVIFTLMTAVGAGGQLFHNHEKDFDDYWNPDNGVRGDEQGAGDGPAWHSGDPLTPIQD